MAGGIARYTLRVRLRFDRVQAALERKRRRVLFRTAGYTLRAMRNRIRRRRGTSQPGAAPFGHNGLLKRLTSFQVDAERGTAWFGFVHYRDRDRAGREKVPRLLDEGGVALWRPPTRTVTAADGSAVLIVPEPVRVRYAPRPLTEPVQPIAEAALQRFYAEEGL